MTGLAITIFLAGLFGMILNIWKDRKIDGSTVSLLFTALVGLALLTDPDGFTLPFINYKKKAKEEFEKTQMYSKALKEVIAIQLLNQGRLREEESIQDDHKTAVKIFKEIYGTNYKAAMNSLLEADKLYLTEDEIKAYGLKEADKEIEPFSLKIMNNAE